MKSKVMLFHKPQLIVQQAHTQFVRRPIMRPRLMSMTMVIMLTMTLSLLGFLDAHNGFATGMFEQLPADFKGAMAKELAGSIDEPAKKMAWFTFKNLSRLVVDEATWKRSPCAHFDFEILKHVDRVCRKQ